MTTEPLPVITSTTKISKTYEFSPRTALVALGIEVPDKASVTFNGRTGVRIKVTVEHEETTING